MDNGLKRTPQRRQQRNLKRPIMIWQGRCRYRGAIGTSIKILKLKLRFDAELLGLQLLAFAETNPDTLINSQHAVSNTDGSESLPHVFSNASFLVFSDTSDYDNDGMPDEWEVGFGLDPLTDNANEDSDDDGYSDLEEYLGGSDPKDPGSTPGQIFDDGFEGGEEQ